MNEKIKKVIKKARREIEKILEEEGSVIVSEKDRGKFIREITRPLIERVKFTKAPQLNKPPFFKKVYVIIDKKKYDSWFDKDGTIKEKLELWEKKLATMDWDSRRKNKDETKAIFEVKFNKEEYKSFIESNWVIEEDKETGEKKKKEKKKEYKDNSDDEGMEGFRKKINDDPDWNPEENEDKKEKSKSKPKKVGRKR